MRPSSVRACLPTLGLLLALLPPPHAAAQSGGVVYAGFDHQPLGSAALTLDATATTLTIDNLGSSGGGVVYQLDAEGGTITFGDGIHGRQPPSGSSWNVQGQYRYGGGVSGGIYAGVNPNGPTLDFDYGPVGTNSLLGTLNLDGQKVYDSSFPPSVGLRVEEWPAVVGLSIEDGEMVTLARWEPPVLVVLPDQQSFSCDEVIFRSQTGGVFAGEEMGTISWMGYQLDQVQLLGERFLEGGSWFEVSGNYLLSRFPAGNELSHVVQQGAADGEYVEVPPSPCLDLTQPTARQGNGIAIEELVLQAEPEIGTSMRSLDFMSLNGEALGRIPTHSVEWTNFQPGDPGMTILGGFTELGASSYTVQVFDDGVLVDSESGLGAAVARTKEYVVGVNQTDLDFLQQRASAQVDLGGDQEITILAPTPRIVIGDRVHIIPEQLQIFPDCVEATGVALSKFGDITLKRGITYVALPPAWAFGLPLQSFGDYLLRRQNGALVLSDEYWGPAPQGPLSGGVHTPVVGLQGFRWQLAGDLDPQQLPQGSRRSFQVAVESVSGEPGIAGLQIELLNDGFSIAADFAALGSPEAQVDAYLGSQPVYSGVLQQQGRVLVDADFNEAEYREDDRGQVSFSLGWAQAQAMLIDGQPVLADRVSERPLYRNRGISITDYEILAEDSPGAEVHRASVRPHGAWMSAVGNMRFGDFSTSPLMLEHLDPATPSGVELEAEDDPQGDAYVQLAIADPQQNNVLDGDERLTVIVEEEEEALQAKTSDVAPTKQTFPPGSLSLEAQSGQWSVAADFVAAGYQGFRVQADGLGELYESSSAVGNVALCDGWPTTQVVKGVGEELWIRLQFDVPTFVSVPNNNAGNTTGLTLVIQGVNRPAFGTGHVRFLFEGQTTTALPQSGRAVDVPEEDGPLPRMRSAVRLRPAIPNPFNPRTLLRYELRVPSEVELSIYDLAGRKVRTLVAGPRPAGEGSVVWDGRDARGRPVASSTYLVQLRTGEGSAREKIVLVR